MLKERRCALLFPAGRRSNIKRGSAYGTHHYDTKDQQSDTVAVLRVKLHCPACVTEVTRSLQRVQGVMEVSADAKAEMITVKGCMLEAGKLCESVRKKTGKRCEVVLLSSIHDLQQMQAQQQQQQADHVTLHTTASTTLQDQTPPSMLRQQELYVAGAAPKQQQYNYMQQQQQQLESTAAAGGGTSAAAPDVDINRSTSLVDVQRDYQNIASIEIQHHIDQTTNDHGWPTPASHQNWMIDPAYTSSCMPDVFSAYAQLHQQHDAPQFRYEELLSEENPNACMLM